MTSNKLAIIAVTVAVVALGAFLAYRGMGPGNMAANPPYVIEEVPIERPLPPDLGGQIKFTPGIAPEVRNAVLSNIAQLKDRLKKEEPDFDAWLTVGALYKVAGDYERARLAWEYAAVLSPANNPAFGNLGNLYHSYLKDYPKAEQYYMRAITNEKDYIEGYRGLYELYRYSYSAKAGEAPTILLNGIAANPQNTDLLVLLAGYYREKGDKENARLYYGKALTLAEKGDNPQLVNLLKTELSTL